MPEACLVGIAGVGVSICLDIGAKSKLTVVIIVNPLLGEELPGTVILGNTSLGWEVVGLHWHFFHKILDHYLGNGSVRQPMEGRPHSLLDEPVVPFCFILMVLRRSVLHLNIQVILDWFKQRPEFIVTTDLRDLNSMSIVQPEDFIKTCPNGRSQSVGHIGCGPVMQLLGQGCIVDRLLQWLSVRSVRQPGSI